MLLSFRPTFLKLSRDPWSGQRFCQRGLVITKGRSVDDSPDQTVDRIKI
jgi:hypothetical protein